MKDIKNAVELKRIGDWDIRTNVPHHIVRHSPTGFEWGYGGSGPADLALNIVHHFVTTMLWDGEIVYAGKYNPNRDTYELTERLYMAFKKEFLVHMPREGGTILAATIKEWIKDKEAKAPEFKIKRYKEARKKSAGIIMRYAGCSEEHRSEVESLITNEGLTKFMEKGEVIGVHDSLDEAMKYAQKNAPYPAYGEIKKIKVPGVYIGFYHGFEIRQERRENWGAKGPIFGPLEYVHVTYLSLIRAKVTKEFRPDIYECLGIKPVDDTLTFTVNGDVVEINEVEYGDWFVFQVTG